MVFKAINPVALEVFSLSRKIVKAISNEHPEAYPSPEAPVVKDPLFRMARSRGSLSLIQTNPSLQKWVVAKIF